MHPAALESQELLKQCEVTRTRRSGPGGQNRNKVETAVVLKHRPTGVTAEANERRHQNENLEEAVFRLRVKLALEVREKPGKPSHRWRPKVSPHNDDFPQLLAEALDHLSAGGWDAKLVAKVFSISTTSLVNLLKEEPKAFAMLNKEREARGLRRFS